MIRFLLNDKAVSTELPPGLPLLDFIRYHQQLTGTKIGCREGDCGACTVLIGSLINGELRYDSMTSCLLPLANVHEKHVVTIEGINLGAEDHATPELNLVQKAMAEQGATQCGFCTPGFVVSLAGFCLGNDCAGEKALASIDGNICRCTGYKSIERAAGTIAEVLEERKEEGAISFAIRKNILPSYFKTVKDQLRSMQNGVPALGMEKNDSPVIAGGTDLYVQKGEELVHTSSSYLYHDAALKNIHREENILRIGASVTVSDLRNSQVFNEAFPAFHQYSKLVSSTPIRNMATVAGNFINASPIGDLTIFFLALDVEINLRDRVTGKSRSLPLREFYRDYKKIDRRESEILENLQFSIPGDRDFFHFEKVSKRTHLDIATVNTAIRLRMKGQQIESAAISAGGVAPIPLFLREASKFLSGREIRDELVNELIPVVEKEISPISDARGSKEYKRLLLVQLIRAHFQTYFEGTKVQS